MWKFQKEHRWQMAVAVVIVALGIRGLNSSGLNEIISIAAIILGSVYAGALLNQPPSEYLKQRRSK